MSTFSDQGLTTTVFFLACVCVCVCVCVCCTHTCACRQKTLDGSFVLPVLWWKFSDYLYTLKVIVSESPWLGTLIVIDVTSVTDMCCTKLYFTPLPIT